MPDKRISDLTAIVGDDLADGDLFALVKVSDSTNKKITRAELLAGLSTRVTFSNAAKTLDAADRYAAQTGTLSASRIVTLQAANSVPAGAQVVVVDESGSVTATNTIEVKPAGADTVDGIAAATNYPVIRDAYGAFTFRSDGSSKWTVINRKPGSDVQRFTANGTWRKPFGCTKARGLLIGAGASGGGGGRSASGSHGYGGSGGGAAGITGFEVPVVDLSATETVTVGTSVTGGAGKTSTNGAGTDGSSGGSTSFSAATKWIAQGGVKGLGGGASSQALGGAGGNGTTVGASGGNGSNGATGAGTAGGNGAGTATGAPFPCVAPGAGGGGGGGGGTNRAGQKGGDSSPGVSTNAAGLAGGAATTGAPAGTAGNPGTSASSISTNSEFGGSCGGGGGQGGTTVAGAVGGAAGNYGGGGGGGAGGSGHNGGNGGDSGAGIAVIWSY